MSRVGVVQVVGGEGNGGSRRGGCLPHRHIRNQTAAVSQPRGFLGTRHTLLTPTTTTTTITLASILPGRSDASTSRRATPVRGEQPGFAITVASLRFPAHGGSLPCCIALHAHACDDSTVIDITCGYGFIIRPWPRPRPCVYGMTVSVSIRPSFYCPEPKSDVHAFPPLCNSGTLKTLPCQSCIGFTSVLLEVLMRACACLCVPVVHVQGTVKKLSAGHSVLLGIHPRLESMQILRKHMQASLIGPS